MGISEEIFFMYVRAVNVCDVELIARTFRRVSVYKQFNEHRTEILPSKLNVRRLEGRLQKFFSNRCNVRFRLMYRLISF